MTLFDKYSFRQKNVALLVIGGMLALAAYKRSFSKTIELRNYITELEEKKSQATQSSQTINILQAQIANINKLIGKENTSIEEVQQSFLNLFSRHGSNLTVQKIDEVYTFDHPDFSINTFRIDVKGNFLAMLKFLNKLENKYHEARLIHTTFEVVKNQKNDQMELITTIILQNYVQKIK